MLWQQVEKTLVDLKSEYTIVMVTHNIHQAIRIADYAVHIYLGEIVEHGHAGDFFENPKEARTRAYVTGNILGDGI